MIKEYGGYMPLELKAGEEFFDRYPEANVARFNCGRNAICAALLSVNPSKVFLPYYICEVVRQSLELYSIPYELYSLDDNLEPNVDSINDNEWIIYVNYFGTMPESKIDRVVGRYKRVVIDNTQAFFAKPIFNDYCFNVYLPRKFFGLIDGAYLVWEKNRALGMDYPIDVSWERGSYLLKSAELGTNAAYQDNLDSMNCFSEGIKIMSHLTEKMLKSIEYDKAAETRQENYQTLINELNCINEYKLPLDGFAPYVYPLLIKKEGLRQRLVENKIYVPQWWKYLLSEVPDDSQEALFSRWLLPLPIDHRYTADDMRDIAYIIKNSL